MYRRVLCRINSPASAPGYAQYLRALCQFTLLTLAAAPAFAQTYAGSAACAACHPKQYQAQQASAHAKALSRAADHPVRADFPADRLFARAPSYRFRFSRGPAGFAIRLTDGTEVMDLPVEWAFGAGGQAVTFVTRASKDWYVEHFASYYRATRAWGATPGQDAIKPRSIAEAAGVMYKIADPKAGIAACFECHSTGPVTFGAEGEARLTEIGVKCEACHGPSAAHVAEPARVRPRNPKTLTAAALNEFCGKCHRPPAQSGEAIDWNYAWNVRHQPAYLAESRCFLKSGGKLTCLTCHDPHEAAGSRKASDYNARCRSCHAVAASKPANCVDCHMPLVSPQSPLRFSNHWIGVYANGAKLKPRR